MLLVLLIYVPFILVGIVGARFVYQKVSEYMNTFDDEFEAIEEETHFFAPTPYENRITGSNNK